MSAEKKTAEQAAHKRRYIRFLYTAFYMRAYRAGWYAGFTAALATQQRKTRIVQRAACLHAAQQQVVRHG